MRPLVDILSEMLNDNVVMSGSDYVLMSDKSVVSSVDVGLAVDIYNAEALSESKTLQKSKVNIAFTTALDILTGLLAKGEETSWKVQEEEARGFKLDANSLTPMLSEMVISRGLGETVNNLADIVIAKADAYKVGYGKLLGKQQGKIKAIDAETDISNVKLIVW